MIKERIVFIMHLALFFKTARKVLFFIVLFSLAIAPKHFVFGQEVLADSQPVSEQNRAAYAVRQMHCMIAEDFMDKVFQRGGWSKLSSKIGPHGIDGLYITKNSSGTVTGVMVAESKFGSSSLTPKQMTHEWISNNIDRYISKLEKQKSQCKSPKELMKIESQLKEYRQVKEHIQRGKYRPRLSHVTVANGKAIVKNYELVEKNGKVKKGPRTGKPIEIDLSDPPTKGKFAEFYRDYFDSVQKELQEQLAKQGLERSAAKKAAIKITEELQEEFRNNRISNRSEQYDFLIREVLQEKINNTPNALMKYFYRCMSDSIC